MLQKCCLLMTRYKTVIAVPHKIIILTPPTGPKVTEIDTSGALYGNVPLKLYFYN